MAETKALSTPPEESLPDPADLPTAVLLTFLPAEFTESVVTRVIHQRSQLTSDARAELDVVLNDEVSIPQFPRYPAKAPPPILKQAILRHVQESESLVTAILKVWFASQFALRDLVVERLREIDMAVSFPDFEEYQLNGYWPYDDWSSLCDEIVEAHGGLDREEVGLMLCCVTGKLPMFLATRTEDESRTMKSDLLHQTLTYLKELPANSTQWEAAVPTFLSSIAELSEAKAAERADAASLEELIKALSEFGDQYTQLLEYFELDISDWTDPTYFDASVLADVHGLLARLSGFFEEHRSIPQRGSSLTETKYLNEKREELEDRILCVKSELDQVLTVEGGPDERPHKPTSDELSLMPDTQTEVPEASTDATLSDLQLSEGGFEFDPTKANHTVLLPNRVDSLIIAPVPNVPTATVDVSVESLEHDGTNCVQAEVGRHRVENVGVGQTTVAVTVTAEDGATSQTYILSIVRAPSDDAALRSLHSTEGELEFDSALREYSIDIADGSRDLSVVFETTHDSATVMATLEHPDGTIVDLITSENGVCEILGLADGQSTLSLAVTAEDDVTTHTYRLTLTHRFRPTSDHAALMWSLVAEDDLAGAYWISRSLAAQRQVPSNLPTLLKAVQAARWLSPESRSFVEDLFATVSQTEPSFGDDAYVMLALAASIQPSIIAPETNLLAWLVAPSRFPSLGKLVTPVRNFANWGYALGPEHIRGDEWHRRLQNLISEANSNARLWLEDSSKRHHNFMRANTVWRHLCTEGGMLSKLLSRVADDHRSEVSTVKNDVEALNQEAFRSDLINETDQSLRPSPKSDIAGAARDWLHRGIIQGTDIAAWWCDLVDRENDSRTQSQNQWLSDHVAELRTQIAAASQDALDDLSKVASDSTRSDLAASALCLTRSIHRLLDHLSIDHGVHHPSIMPPVVADLQQVNQNAGFSGRGIGPNSKIEIALSRRLLWIPAVELRDDGLPVNAEEPIDLQRAEPDWFSTDTPLDVVVASRIGNGDFRFLDLLSLDSATGQPVKPEVAYSTDLAAARETLEEHHSRACDAVEQAASDGVIEFEGARWNELTYSLEDIAVDKIRNFKQAQDVLETIEVSVRDNRINRREELTREWDTFIRNLGEDTNVAPEVLEELTATFKLASRDDALDIRVMEDCVSRIRNFQSGDPQDLVRTPSERPRRTLEDFLRFSLGIGELRRVFVRSKDEEYDPQVQEVIENWELLKQERPRDRTGPTSKGRIGTVLRFLGLRYQNESELTLRKEDRSGRRWVYFTFETDPGGINAVRGAPQFGSQANGTYHIFCLWEDARPDRITHNASIDKVAKGSQGAIVVLYLDALTEAERHDIRSECWANDLTIPIVDEVLLAFLARCEGDRFRPFLEVSLPFTAANPYNPETAGWGSRVAPEMFYGREQLAREIEAMRDGTSLIFGGRQLGKTALLRRVEERGSDPDLRRFAWFIDLKASGYVPDAKPSKDPRDILEVLHDRFRQDDILGDDANGHSQEQIRQDILDAFDNDRDLQVLAMFDESDAFLQSDWTSGSAVVESLRALMDNTGNRFKVVFAGLHNVQRFANRPNNPFPNLGFNPNSPRRGGIGPLSDHEARDLVEQPFSLLGFRFEPLVVDKILSYTNRHPSLIQFFCHELILSYKQSNPDGSPPFTIGIEEVDRVHRTQSIQGGIKRRFKATFELDPRYHVIALTMILDQEHPTQSWSLDELRSYCQSYCPLTFDPDSLSDLELRSLLNELIGLGVLAQDVDSYRMRSSLLAQMFGSEDEVFDMLGQLEADEPYSVD